MPVKITQPNRVITLDYDTQGNLLQRTISAGGLARTWKYIYNAQGLMTSVNGPRLDMTDITTYTYDASGNLTSIINALNQVTQITSYDAHGHPLTIKEPNGLVTQLQYDTRGRLISSTIGTEVTSYTYNTVGQIASITLPTGAYLNYSYDSAHRLIQISDSLDNRIVYTLDSMGNRLKEEIFDANNTLTQTRAHVYNQLNRLAQDIGAQSQITNYSYDNNGNNTGAIDPLNHAINNIYDSLNRLIQVVDPSNGATQYTYDANDQITQVIDPKGLSTAYNYDGLGNLSQVQSPDSGMTSRTYDEAGNPKTETDALGKLTTYIYDALNRVKKITYADGALVSFLYDGAANAVGRLYRIYDPNGDTLWSYDTQGRVTQKQQTGGGLSLRISYTYNGQGQLASITYPSGKVIQYSYNQGQVSAIAVAAQPLLNNVQHQPFGAAKNWQWGNGVNYTRQFDQDGRLVSYVLGTSMRTLSYDAADRITGMTIPVNQSLSYDSLDRLIQYSTPTTNQSYSYDSNGNRTALSIDANTYPYTYASASNRLNQINGPIFSTYTYNAAGSLIQDNGHSYIYSATGRLARVSYGASNNYYKINGLGQRVRKYGAGVVSGMNVFMYDESGHLIGEYDASGLPIEETIYLENVPVAVLRGNNIYYIHADHLNAPRVITDTSNRIVWRWDSDPFGVGAANEDPDGDLVKFNYNLRFPGQYFDKETGLYYNMARDYDSQTGRYIQSDPIGLAGGLNPYTYVSNNPLSFIDPLGLAQVTYDSRNQTVTVYEGGSTKVHQFPAGNNTTSTSNGPWPSGTFPFDRWKAHPESGPDGPYGSFGNFIFDVPGRTGMGIHSGRSGPQSKTEGCIRTTDDATELLDRLSNNPNPRLRDPITVISVW
ncbi:MAG TPA: RHS repeat-associated core domain-containing protein [Gammaproteobacteria bacterium]|nr:RHS repeat-associated core domain-containing protein [Gammaproteobacteria bacterium]